MAKEIVNKVTEKKRGFLELRKFGIVVWKRERDEEQEASNYDRRQAGSKQVRGPGSH